MGLAIYTLASREAPLDKKRSFVEDYRGQTKTELLTLIRQYFPLDDEDGRRQNAGEALLLALKRIRRDLQMKTPSISRSQKTALSEVLQDISDLIHHSK